jgi:hypothetical protein
MLRLTTSLGDIFADEATLAIPGSALAITGIPGGSVDDGLRFQVSVPDAGAIRVDLVDIAGRMVAGTRFRFIEAGVHEVRLVPRLPIRSGVFLARITQGVRSAATKVIVVH